MANITKHKETKQRLKRSAIRIAAREGIENLTTKKIASTAGVAEVYIYRYFEGKDDLLVQCFLDIDREIADVINTGAIKNKLAECKLHNAVDTVRIVWCLYWDYLMRHPEKTLYYFRFYLSANYNADIAAQRHLNYSAFLSIIENAFQHANISGEGSIWSFLDHVAESTLLAATRFIRDNMIHMRMKPANADVERIFTLVVRPVVQLVCDLYVESRKMNDG